MGDSSRRARFLVTVLLLGACGGSDSWVAPAAEAPVDGEFPATVGPRGGVLVGADGTGFEGVRLELPEGALGAATALDLVGTLTDVPPSSETSRFVGVHVGFSPDGLALAKPARLRVPLSTSVVSDHDQTPADCKVWLRTADGWEQVQPIDSDESSVTIEVTTLRTAAAGIVLKSPRPLPTAPFPIDCVPGQGICVQEMGGALKSGAAPHTLSDVVDGKFFYLRQTGTGRHSVVEHDSAAGAAVRESQSHGGVPTGAIEVPPQRLSRAPDGSVWAAIGGFGAVQFPFPGLPTSFPDPKPVRTFHVVHDGVGTLRRIGVHTTTVKATATSQQKVRHNAALVQGTFFSEGPSHTLLPSLTPARLVVARADADPRVFGLAVGTPFIVGVPPQGFLLPPATGFAELLINANHANDCLAMSPTGAAVAFSDGAGKVTVRRDGLNVSTHAIGVDLAELEFDTGGVLYAFTRTRAEVYRLDPATGGFQSISLSSAAPDSAEYRARIPQAIRRLPGAGMLVVVGATSPTVIRLVPAP